MLLLRRKLKHQRDAGPAKAALETPLVNANPLALRAKTSAFHSKHWVAAMILATGLAGDFGEITEDLDPYSGIPEHRDASDARLP